MKLLTNSKNPFSNPLQRSFSGHFDPENAYRNPPMILKTRTESRLCQVNFAYFAGNQSGIDTGENRPMTEEGIVKRV